MGAPNGLEPRVKSRGSGGRLGLATLPSEITVETVEFAQYLIKHWVVHEVVALVANGREKEVDQEFIDDLYKITSRSPSEFDDELRQLTIEIGRLIVKTAPVTLINEWARAYVLSG